MMAESASQATNENDRAEADSQAGSQSAMTVKVYAPFQVYYEGEARSVSAVNNVGPFDILPGHRNFLCMLVPCQIKIDTADKGIKQVKINRALMHVHSNHVTVFVDV